MLFRGSDTLLMTQFGEFYGKPIPLEQAEYQLGFKVNPAILSYSLPFFSTLHFATQKKDYLGGFLVGIFILYPLILLGTVCLSLKELMVNLGPLFFEQPDTFVPGGNVIALFYQLNVLIVPTVAPIVLWALPEEEPDTFNLVALVERRANSMW